VLGHLVAGLKGRQVLAGGPQRPAPAWCQRRSDRLVDGLKGFPEAVEAVVPGHGRRAPVVHQVRSSPRYVTYTDRKKVSPTQGRRRRHRRRRRRSPNWPPSDPFLALPADLRRIVYTTAASRTSTANPQGDQDPPATSPTNKPPPAHLPRHPPRQDRLQAPLPLAQRPAQDPLRRPTPRLTTINPQPRPHTQKVGQSPGASRRGGKLANFGTHTVLNFASLLTLPRMRGSTKQP